jgi:hypothetical protein
VKLSPKEYELLRLLVQHAGQVLTHRFLLQELWDELPNPQYLRVYVRQLRQKIETYPERPQYLMTERSRVADLAAGLQSSGRGISGTPGDFKTLLLPAVLPILSARVSSAHGSSRAGRGSERAGVPPRVGNRDRARRRHFWRAWLNRILIAATSVALQRSFSRAPFRSGDRWACEVYLSSCQQRGYALG